jgi:copper resistance protein B
MKRALWLLLFPLAVHAAEHDHSAQIPAPASEPAAVDHSAHTPAPADPVDHSAHTPAPAEVDHSAHMPQAPDVAVERDNSPAMQEARHMGLMMHGDSLNFLVLGERFEQLEDDGATSRVWEAQGWLGYDHDKLWFKTEGAYDVDDDRTEHSEVQALYSRAVAPFWDMQLGLRRDDIGSAARHYAAFGMQGLAPYWFEVDAAAFVSEQGDVSARLEAEYELRFTQKLLLQPRLELNYSFADDQEFGVGQGFSETAFGLRLRYEIRREFAPYVGVEWSRAYGNTAMLLHAAGQDREELSVVAGLRFWY